MSPDEGVPATLREALEGHTVDVLQRLMRALSIAKPQPTRKADMVQVVAERMADDSLLRDIWAELDPQEQMAVRETIYDDGEFDAVRFEAKYGSLPGGLRRSTGYRQRGGGASDALRLLFVPEYRDGPLTYVPGDLSVRLREIAAPPPPVALRTTDELPETVSILVGYGENETTKTLELTVRSMERAAANGSSCGHASRG